MATSRTSLRHSPIQGELFLLLPSVVLHNHTECSLVEGALMVRQVQCFGGATLGEAGFFLDARLPALRHTPRRSPSDASPAAVALCTGRWRGQVGKGVAKGFFFVASSHLFGLEGSSVRPA